MLLLPYLCFALLLQVILLQLVVCVCVAARLCSYESYCYVVFALVQVNRLNGRNTRLVRKLAAVRKQPLYCPSCTSLAKVCVLKCVSGWVDGCACVRVCMRAVRIFVSKYGRV